MKVFLNMDGKKFPVVNMSLVGDAVVNVQIKQHDGAYKVVYDLSQDFVNGIYPKLNLVDHLEYPQFEVEKEENNKRLIDHLEMRFKEENDQLIDFAISAMENDSDLPFDTNLVNMQKEYKLLQQRLFGILDTIEEVKAFQEGYFDNQEVNASGDTL